MSKTNPIPWYNLVAPLYDLSVKGVYNRARQETMRQLQLEPGQTVLDIACGTGENFKYLLENLGENGTIIGTDYSAGMLAQARRKTEKNGWKHVHVIQADARMVSLDAIRQFASKPDMVIDRMLCTLGYSVVLEWESVFQNTWNFLAPGGRYAIMDWYIPTPSLKTKLINRVAASDIHRKIWEPLSTLAEDFQRATFFRGQVFVVSGRKPL